MRDRQILYLFFALNCALAGACLFLLCAGRRQLQSATSTALPAPGAVAASAETSSLGAGALAHEPSNPPRSFYDWRDVWSASYPHYLGQLRAAGCPDDAIVRLVVSDVDNFYTQQRLQAAIAHDHDWWRTEPEPATLAALQTFGQALSQQRAELLKRLLGASCPSGDQSEVQLWRMVPLLGPVLGQLSSEVHDQVQDICSRYQENAQGVSNAAVLAKLQQQVRQQLVAVLGPTQLDEFWVRYSPASQRLRAEMKDFAPSESEFRDLFAGVGPIDERMALEFGELSQLSANQRERHQRLRKEAIKKVLLPGRFEAYLAMRQTPSGS